MCPKVKTLSPINDPGTRASRHGGVVLQFQRRSQQLESIAAEVTNILEAGAPAPLAFTADKDDQRVKISPSDSHRIIGYMNQLQIIAAELKDAGK